VTGLWETVRQAASAWVAAAPAACAADVAHVGADPALLIWPVLFALGIVLLVTADARPSLAERLAWLSLDTQLAAAGRSTGARTWRPGRASTLGHLVGPLLADLEAVAGAVLARLPVQVVGREELARQLGLVYGAASLLTFSLRKLKAGAAFGLIVAALSLLGVVETPAWAWLAAGVLASWLPDLELQLLLNRRRDAIVRQMPPFADHLVLGLSAGFGLEQALHDVVDEAGDVELTRELELVARAPGQTLDEALLALVERNGIPEVERLATVLRSGYVQGERAVGLLAGLARDERSQAKSELVASGAQASIKMVIPMVVFMLPPLAIVLVVPMLTQLGQLGGG
jgi:tight adherence protein C